MRVQCLLPKRNNGEYIEAALQSLLGQQTPFSRIVVSDNYSTDGSWPSLLDMTDGLPQVAVVRPPEPCESYGAHLAWLFTHIDETCEYTLIAASDDIWHSDFNSVMLGVIGRLKDPNLQCLFSDRIVIDQKGRRLGTTGSLTRPTYLAGMQAFSYYTKGCCYIISGAYFKTELLVELRSLVSQTGNSADWILILEAARRGGVRYVAQTLFDYRLHQASTTSQAIGGSSAHLNALQQYFVWLTTAGDLQAAAVIHKALSDLCYSPAQSAVPRTQKRWLVSRAQNIGVRLGLLLPIRRLLGR